MSSLRALFRCDRGDSFSYLVLILGLVAAAVAAKPILGDIVGGLVDQIEVATTGDAPAPSASGGGGGGGGGGGRGGGGGGDTDTPDGDTEDPGPDAPGGDAGEPETPGDEDDADSPETDPPADPEPCVPGVHTYCGPETNCLSFTPVACSHSPQAQEAHHKAEAYESCAQPGASPVICRDIVPLLETTTRGILEFELGIHPGQFYERVADLCDSGHPSCDAFLNTANLFYERRVEIAATVVGSKLIPGPSLTSCSVGAIDGEISDADLLSCALSFAF